MVRVRISKIGFSFSRIELYLKVVYIYMLTFNT